MTSMNSQPGDDDLYENSAWGDYPLYSSSPELPIITSVNVQKKTVAYFIRIFSVVASAAT